MEYIKRLIEKPLQDALSRGKSVLLLGARQTGKTTLIDRLATDFSISFAHPRIRQRYEQNPSILIGEIEALTETLSRAPLMIIDEVQKAPEVLDAVQYLIDKNIAQFILTGSSARKLRLNTKVNLLPGRVVVLHLDPLTLNEIMPLNSLYKITLENLLVYGALPGILNVPEPKNKNIDLESYSSIYLEEEVRAEALVRNLGVFGRFLSLAASESGDIVNFRKLSQEIGIAHTTIASYYQILEDCLIAERIEPYLETKTRRKLVKSSKYLFFDLGVRRICAREGCKLSDKFLGRLFEQWVGLELVRYAHLATQKTTIYFWRDAQGVEVDWVIVQGERIIPVEVKWTENPNISDTKYLSLFLNEHENADKAYIICRTPAKIKFTDAIYAIPWQDISELIPINFPD